MPQDVLQIGLEHHRAGRLRQAEARYRAVLEETPGHPEALHWLGVLMVQAGQPGRAVPLLERAAAARPDDAAFAANLAQAYLHSRRIDEAIAGFDRALSMEPDRTETLFSAGVARLARKGAGDAEEAIRLFRKARAAGLRTAELHQHLGIALLMAGWDEEAILACGAAVELKPDYVEAHYHMGVAYRQKGQVEDARRHLAEAIRLQPGYTRAVQAMAVLEAENGRLAESEALFRKALALEPGSPAVHQALGMVLQKMGRQNEATLSFIQAVRATKAAAAPAPPAAASEEGPVADLERKLTLSPEAAALHFRLAKQTGIAPPAQVPASSVSGLFDRYAELFDEHLLGKLEYRAPELIVEAVAATHPTGPLDVLDLGCGTGLCGPLLRPMAATLVGVDLSPAMIEKARQRGVYDRLEAADLNEVMLRSPGTFDLLVAADVLMYLGDLAPTFEAAAGALRPGGLFAFSVEATEGERYAFDQQTHRFVHGAPYIKHLASIYGFVEESFSRVVVRQEAGRPVTAHRVVLRLRA